MTFVRILSNLSLSLVFITRGRRYRPPPLRLPSSRDSYSSMYMLLLLLLLVVVVVTLFVLFPSLHSFISISYLALSFSCFASNGFRSSSRAFATYGPRVSWFSAGCVPFGRDGRARDFAKVNVRGPGVFRLARFFLRSFSFPLVVVDFKVVGLETRTRLYRIPPTGWYDFICSS